MILQWLLLLSLSFCSLQQRFCISISSFERRHGSLFLYLSEASVHCSNRGTMLAEQANVFCIVEYNGYIGRAVSSRQTPDWTLGPYIVQAVLLLVAPALFAATIYMELGRIIILVDGEHHSIIKKRWLTKTFVCGDIVSFLMQAGGTFSTDSNEKGRWVDFIRRQHHGWEDNDRGTQWSARCNWRPGPSNHLLRLLRRRRDCLQSPHQQSPHRSLRLE